MFNDKDENKHAAKTSTAKIVAIAVAAAMVTAGLLAATGGFAGIIAYAQQGDDSDMTTFEEEANGSEDANTSTMSDELGSQSNDTSTASNDTSTQSEETTTASAIVSGSTCAPAMTASDVGIDDVTTTADLAEDDDVPGEDAGELEDENGPTDTSGASTSDNSTTTSSTTGLNDSQSATADALIEKACEAIRDGKSVTALGLLASVQDMLSGVDAGTEAAADTEAGTDRAAQTLEQEDDDTVEDEDEPGDIDATDDEDELEENDE